MYQTSDAHINQLIQKHGQLIKIFPFSHRSRSISGHSVGLFYNLSKLDSKIRSVLLCLQELCEDDFLSVSKKTPKAAL